MLQIHQQKGEIVKDVDTGERFGEFEAIEQRRLVVDQTYVAQMQVAVASPHFARCATGFQQSAGAR